MAPNAHHLDDATAMAFRHGEIADPAERVAIQHHLAECDSCRGLVNAVSGEDEAIDRALRQLDHEAPRLTAADIVAVAGHTDSSWRRWAAAALLTMTAAGAAVALPGSPVRDWFVALIGKQPPRAPAPAPEPPTPVSPVFSGVEVAPGSQLLIEFARWQPNGLIVVRLHDGPSVTVRTAPGAAAFTSESGRLAVDNAGAEPFDIGVPATAPRVEIRVGSQPVFLFAAGRVIRGPQPDSAGVWRISLAR